MDWKLILQIAGVALGLVYLWLEYRADIRLWIVGLIMPVVHGALYFHSGLYADASMQVYYVAAGLYGWIVWRAARKSTNKTAPRQSSGSATTEPRTAPRQSSGTAPRQSSGSALGITHTPLGRVPALAGACVCAFVALYLVLEHFTDSTVPFWDSLTTSLSVVAMWMLSRKYVEQWLVWLVVDVVTVGLYLYKDIPLTAGLYALYSALALAGYLRWRRQIA